MISEQRVCSARTTAALLFNDRLGSQNQKRHNMKSLPVEILLCIALLFSQMHSQDKMYHNTFPLSDVSLLDGPLKHARDLNIQTLLK